MAKAKPLYQIGDAFTFNKSGITGLIEKITPIKADLTRVAVRTPFNEYRLALVKTKA